MSQNHYQKKKHEVRYLKKIVIQHWNEVSEQVMELTSLTVGKNGMNGMKKLANQFFTLVSIKCYSGEIQKKRYNINPLLKLTI